MGELDRVAEARQPFREFAEQWVERYHGSGRGFTDSTRREYQRDLVRYAYPRLGDLRLSSITPKIIAEWVAWLADDAEQGKRVAVEKRAAKAAKLGVRPSSLPLDPKPKRLSDQTIKRIVCPVRAAFSSARREGLLRSNPVDGVVLPYRPQIKDAEVERAKAPTRAQLAAFFLVCPPRWKMLFLVLASSGVRWGELAALRWKDLQLDGSEPHLRVRRALARPEPGKPLTFKVPKSRFGCRDIPLDVNLCRALRERRRSATFATDDDLVFPDRRGGPLRQENHRRRVLQPAAQEAGIPWLGYHGFRHAYASMQIEGGRNLRQLQALMGHHSPTFTLQRYAHLMDAGVGEPLDLGAELAGVEGGSKVGPLPPETEGNEGNADLRETVS